jgi:hypothetical protein
MSSYRASRHRTQKSPDWRFLFVLRLLILLAFVAFGLCLIFFDSLPISRSYDLNMSEAAQYGMGALIIVYGFYRFYINLPRKAKTEE